MNVSIDVLITVEKVYVYRVRTRIISVATGDSRCGIEVLHEQTELYPRRTYDSVKRKSYEKARQWIAEHGYTEYEPEPEQSKADPTASGEVKTYYIREVGEA